MFLCDVSYRDFVLCNVSLQIKSFCRRLCRKHKNSLSRTIDKKSCQTVVSVKSKMIICVKCRIHNGYSFTTNKKGEDMFLHQLSRSGWLSCVGIPYSWLTTVHLYGRLTAIEKKKKKFLPTYDINCQPTRLIYALWNLNGFECWLNCRSTMNVWHYS